MKTQNLKSIVFSVLTSTVLLSSSCKKENQVAPSLDAQTVAGIGDIVSAQFDPEKFAEGIEAYMNGKVAGYGYTIAYDGKLFYKGVGGGGWARKAVDAPATKHGANVRQGIASSTKFITALTTVATLEKCGVKLTDKVYPYLPTNWKPTNEFKQITFEQLLCHRTGLINYGEEIADLKKTVEGGVNLQRFNDSAYFYDNVNYWMPIILLPYVYAKKFSPADYTYLKSIQNNSEALYKALGSRYISMARVYIFKPSGLLHWQAVDWCTWNNLGPINPALGTLGYTTVNGQEKGTQKGDNRSNGGAGGLYISASEFARIQRATAKGEIISLANYKAMKDKLLGFDGAYQGKRGKYSWKNGGANNHETIIFDFGPVQVAVFANSRASEFGNDRSIISNAYDKAWTN